MTMERRLAVLERVFGNDGRGWDDDTLRRHVRRAAIEQGLNEEQLFVEATRVLEFAQERDLPVDSWVFVEAWAKETGDDVNALAAALEQARRDEANRSMNHHG